MGGWSEQVARLDQACLAAFGREIKLALKTRRRLQDWGVAHLRLSADVDADDTILPLRAIPEQFEAAGYDAEVDTEIMLINGVGPNSIEVERGYKGTTASSHAEGTAVYVQARFTNTAIVDALNRAVAVLGAVCPKVVTTDVTVESGVEEHPFPDAVGVVGIDYQNSDGFYRPLHRYSVFFSDVGCVVTIPAGVVPVGRLLRVTYISAHPSISYESSDVPWPEPLAAAVVDFAAGLLLEEEEYRVTALTAQATGVVPKPGTNQQIGRALQARALAMLNGTLPPTRIVRLTDARLYRY